MPDGRVSQVRFEALAFQRRTFPSARPVENRIRGLGGLAVFLPASFLSLSIIGLAIDVVVLHAPLYQSIQRNQ